MNDENNGYLLYVTTPRARANLILCNSKGFGTIPGHLVLFNHTSDKELFYLPDKKQFPNEEHICHNHLRKIIAVHFIACFVLEDQPVDFHVRNGPIPDYCKLLSN